MTSTPLSTGCDSLCGGSGVTMARKAIRRHWSQQERRRRRELAQAMQQRLFTTIGSRTIAG